MEDDSAENYPILARDQGDILIADLEELEKLNASEIYARRINAKETKRSQSPVADGTAKICQEETTISENPLWDAP